MATPAQIEMRRKWVEALRSGNYEQGKSMLKSANNRYCCLGVLCDVAEVPSILDGSMYAFGLNDQYTSKSLLYPDIRKTVGLRTELGWYDNGNSLATMNDQGKTFAEIADIIESEPTGLFFE